MKRLLPLILIFLSGCLMFADVPSAPVVEGMCYLTGYVDLQEAVDNCVNGGTVIIPAGVHEIGTVVINNNDEWQKVVNIQGVAPGHLGQSPPLGSGQWDLLLDGGYHYGTVLRGHIVVDEGARLYMNNLSMIGHAEGTAVQYNSTVPNGAFSSVSCGNYETCFYVRGYYLTFDDIDIAGVGTGFDVSGNVISLRDVDIKGCDLGANLSGANVGYDGGSVQGCNDGVLFGATVGKLGNIYFEQIVGYSLQVTGSGSEISPNFYATNSGSVSISGHDNIVFLGLNPSDMVEINGDTNYIYNAAFGQYNDTGWANVIERPYP